MTVSEYRRTLQGTYHGPVLDDVASQVLVDGARLPKKAWHHWFKTRVNEGRSTTLLSDQEYSLYILKCEALAATTLGVEFIDLHPRAEEEWRDVVGYEGCYQVSAAGRVKSLVSKKPGSIRKQYRRPDGYMEVQLKVDQVPVNRTVHTLVDEAFNGPRVEGLEVNHKDGDKSNNARSNLERLTHVQNMAHAVATGLMANVKGEAHGRARLTEAQVQQIRAETGQRGPDGKFKYGTISALARRFKVSHTCVMDVLSGKNWAHLPTPLQPRDRDPAAQPARERT